MGDDENLVAMFRQGCPWQFSDVKCALKLMDKIESWLKKHNNFQVLITGKMGTGKTTLIKGLKEKYIPEADNLLPHTVKVTPYEYEHEKIKFTFIDTPGLRESSDSHKDYEYLKEMVKKNERPDLIIFTIKMDDTRLRPEDEATIKNVSDAFGWSVWKNAMFLLTFANKVSKVGSPPGSRENKVYFNRQRDEFSLLITKELRKNRVQPEVADSIPVIPAGLVMQPSIPSDSRGISWVDEFWKEMFKVLKASRYDSSASDKEEENSSTSTPSSPTPKKTPVPTPTRQSPAPTSIPKSSPNLAHSTVITLPKKSKRSSAPTSNLAHPIAGSLMWVLWQVLLF